MNIPDPIEIADAAADASPDFSAVIDSLRTAGAERFDPVRLHYIDVLGKRAMVHEGSTRRMLDARLAQAVEAFKERFNTAQSNAREALEQSVQQYPHAAKDLQQFFSAGDFNGLQRCIAGLKSREQCASLGALVRRLEQHSQESAEASPAPNPGPRTELKAIRNFRNTWAKLSVDKQVAQALQHAPKNAGPINSHMLVLRSLTLMRDISPDYLGRFMTYADTLLSLDQCEKDKPAAPKKQPASKTAKK
jgi:hypothetical protein